MQSLTTSYYNTIIAFIAENFSWEILRCKIEGKFSSFFKNWSLQFPFLTPLYFLSAFLMWEWKFFFKYFFTTRPNLATFGFFLSCDASTMILISMVNDRKDGKISIYWPLALLIEKSPAPGWNWSRESTFGLWNYLKQYRKKSVVGSENKKKHNAEFKGKVRRPLHPLTVAKDLFLGTVVSKHIATSEFVGLPVTQIGCFSCSFNSIQNRT